MFITWILSFFNYYFIMFQQGSGNYIISLLSAKLESKDIAFFGVLEIDPSLVSFKLTEEAVSKGYSSLDMFHLTKEWYIQAQISSYFKVYFTLVNYLNYFILLLQIVIWFYLSQLFFFPLVKDFILSINLLVWIQSAGKAATRSYATEARRVLPPFQKEVGKITEGVHKDNHPALVDPAIRNPDKPSEILYEGQPTHYRKFIQNISEQCFEYPPNFDKKFLIDIALHHMDKQTKELENNMKKLKITLDLLTPDQRKKRLIELEIIKKNYLLKEEKIAREKLIGAQYPQIKGIIKMVNILEEKNRIFKEEKEEKKRTESMRLKIQEYEEKQKAKFDTKNKNDFKIKQIENTPNRPQITYHDDDEK